MEKRGFRHRLQQLKRDSVPPRDSHLERVVKADADRPGLQ